MIYEIIGRVLVGSSSDDDRKKIKEWLQSGEKNRKEFEKLESIWDAAEILSNRRKFDPASAYRKFYKQNRL